ncbi:MAG: cob(I)yrinic acid a,c-diamide adenosyltransferase [Bdellovibrio sp.]|jgi:cob(I)alamin adenosyltransferase
MKIYTKTGDQGKTRLVGGCLVSKSDLRIESYGSVDELNSTLGLAIEELHTSALFTDRIKELIQVQNELFCLGSLLACEDPEMFKKLPQIPDGAILRLEASIDQMTAKLPELREFILPGGTKAAAMMHMCRTICRRAERNTVKLYEAHPEVEPALIYLNRLSDYFFTAARACNFELGHREQIWEKS